MNRITRLSKILQTCFWIWFAMMPTICILYWYTNGLASLKPIYDFNLIPITSDAIKPIAEMNISTRIMGMFVSLLPVIIDMLAIYSVIRLFRHFAKNEYFTAGTVFWIQRAALFLLLNQLIYPVYTGLLSLVLTIQNPPGQRMISFALGDQQLTLTIVALTILLISWIMEEGRKINEDLEGTV